MLCMRVLGTRAVVAVVRTAGGVSAVWRRPWGGGEEEEVVKDLTCMQ